MLNDILKNHITDELIANRQVFNRLNYVIDEFRGFIYDKSGDYLKHGKEVSDFITEQDKRLTEIDNRPRDYTELYEPVNEELPF